MDNIYIIPLWYSQMKSTRNMHFRQGMSRTVDICWELFVNNSPECDSNLWASVHNNSEHKLAYVVTQDFIYSNTDICILMKG